MENKIPIYRQIEQYIMNNIEDGIYAEGMMIPSEEDFCEKFHTSRMTVRKAFDILQTKGILHKKKGKGTFVSTFSIEKNMQTIHGWKETMQMAGYRTRSDLLKIAMEKADEKIAKKLHIDVYKRQLQRDDLLPMWLADMDLPASDEIKEALMKRASHPIYGYSDRGRLYYEVFAERFQKQYAYDITADDVMSVSYTHLS